MFGIGFHKGQTNTYVMQLAGGRIVREGEGLSLFYWAPTSSIVAVPLASVEAPFMFEKASADYQKLTVQGHVTYRIAEPRLAAKLLDFSLAPGGSWRSQDPERLPQRVVNKVEVLVQHETLKLALHDALNGTGRVTAAVLAALRADGEIAALGVEVLGFSILAVKPTPETSRALEAEAREAILKHADEAIYARRNAAVEQERTIKENELNTEIAIESKKRQIRETKMEAEASIQAKQHELDQSKMANRITLEGSNKDLVTLAANNARTEADARAYGMTALLKSFAGVDPKVVQALYASGMQPGQLLAFAFQSLAENAEKIGQLNVSPDLLRELLKEKA